MKKIKLKNMLPKKDEKYLIFQNKILSINHYERIDYEDIHVEYKICEINHNEYFKFYGEVHPITRYFSQNRLNVYLKKLDILIDIEITDENILIKCEPKLW